MSYLLGGRHNAEMLEIIYLSGGEALQTCAMSTDPILRYPKSVV